MKSKSTAIWFALAAVLFAAVWIVEKYFQPAPAAYSTVLPGFHAARVTEVHVIPAAAHEIAVGLTNGVWQLLPPAQGPAQTALIQTLLGSLEKLAPATRLTAEDLRDQKNVYAEYGFTDPQFSLVVSTDDQQWQLHLGNRTALGDQVYVRVDGVDGIFITDASWLQQLPHSVNEWRDTSLVDAGDTYDWILITNDTKVIELHRDATNHLWNITRPLLARADGDRIAAALQTLRAAHSSRFVTDDPRADLTSYGLQPAALDLWLGQGTNLLTAVHAGKPTPENPDQVYARREGLNSVVAVAKAVLLPWYGSVDDFRDPHLLPKLTAPVAEIEVQGGIEGVPGTNHFILQSLKTNQWSIVGDTFPVDVQKAHDFLRMLGSVHIADFVKEHNTPVDLQGFGLTTPSEQITLRGAPGDSNSTLARLTFGAIDTNQNRIFVMCDGENSVYSIGADQLISLPAQDWEFRDRHIWNFATTNIARFILQQSGKSRTVVQVADGKWLPTGGPTGGNKEFNMAAADEAAHYFGEFTVAGWVERNVTDLNKYDLRPENLQITIELKTGEKYTIRFGYEWNQKNIQTAIAAVTLDGEVWAFVFPPVLYQYVLASLIIPPDSP